MFKLAVSSARGARCFANAHAKSKIPALRNFASTIEFGKTQYTPVQEGEQVVLKPAPIITPAVWRDYKMKEDQISHAEWDKLNELNIVTEPVNIDGREITTIGSLIKKYGVVPFAGFSTAILLSKEFVILDAHTVKYLVWAGFWLGTYIAVGDSIFKAGTDFAMKEKRLQNEVNQFAVELHQMNLRRFESAVMAPEVLSQGKEDFNVATKTLFAFKNVQMRHQARDTMLKKLEGIRRREEGQRSSLRLRVEADAVKYLVQKVKEASPADHTQSIETAILHLEGKTRAVEKKDHPVYKHVLNFFQQRPWETQAKQQQRA